MSKIIPFTCLKAQSALQSFEKTRTIPEEILSGNLSLNDIKECFDILSADQIKSYKNLTKAYKKYAKRNLQEIKTQLRSEYIHVINNLETLSSDFGLEHAQKHYREGMNPVTAFCHEIRRCSINYDPDNLYHQWITNILQDRIINNNIISALKQDIYTLNNVIRKYEILFQVDQNIPLELFHAKQTITDFESHLKTFSNVMLDE
jgi:hypothetical protein